MMRKSMLISVLAASLLLGVSYVWVHVHGQKKSAAPKMSPSVTVFKVTAENYQPTIEAVGTLQANQGTVLKAQTDGQVSSIHFEPGDVVKEGDVLVTLNNVQQQGALDAAVAQEQLNKTMYQRDLELKKLGAISLAAVDQAKAALDSGAATVHEAQGAYDLTIVKAPFSGRLGIVKVNLGDYLQSADPIVSLQNLDPMFIDFYVPQKYLPDIKVGETVIATPDTTAKAVSGKIISYETVIDQTTGMLQVRASVPNPQQLLLPGGYVTLHVDVGNATKTMRIPQTAIMVDAQGAYVYLVKENIAHIQRVKIGTQIGQEIQILQGLQVGDEVVSAGTNKVHDNSAIQPVVEAVKDNA